MQILSTGSFKTTTQGTYQYSYVYLNTSDMHNDSFFMYRIEKNGISKL